MFLFNPGDQVKYNSEHYILPTFARSKNILIVEEVIWSEELVFFVGGYQEFAHFLQHHV